MHPGNILNERIQARFKHSLAAAVCGDINGLVKVGRLGKGGAGSIILCLPSIQGNILTLQPATHVSMLMSKMVNTLLLKLWHTAGNFPH